ncbi:glycoside hydrolase family 97 C-terminal domain-containing protein [Streptomyces ossamyceticus]|nr:glycoside hydrolase family 97 C-terminal domain-containing protein [Streptomyces ossamyceticus]
MAVARRKGTTWYPGAMTDESARTLSLPLPFLGGGDWTATVYADGTPGTCAYQTPVVVGTRTVTSATVLSMALASSGGQAVVLKPS